MESQVDQSKLARAHWPDIARNWAQVGPPLRPSAQDIAFAIDAIRRWRGAGAPRALILGVTPELYRLPWPAGSDVLAADHTQAMIDTVWPGPRDGVIRANWTDLPLADASRDIVLCDGGIHLMKYPSDHSGFVTTMDRILAPGGMCIFRLFIPPAHRETVEAVLSDLFDGRISSLNALKLRLGMALQRDAGEGVQLACVWNELHRAAPDFTALAKRLAWSLPHLLAIDSYRNCPKRYHFLTVDEVKQLFCDNGRFVCESISNPAYELGERCPTIVLRRA